MGVLPVDMMKPLPEEPKPEDKPKQNENEIFHTPPKQETNEIVPMDQTAIEESATPPPPPQKTKKARGKSDPEHLKKMREASALRRAERKKEKQEAELVIAEAKVLKEQQLAQRMGGNPNSGQQFDYDKLAEAMDKRRTQRAPVPQSQPTAPPVPSSGGVDYKKNMKKPKLNSLKRESEPMREKELKAKEKAK